MASNQEATTVPLEYWVDEKNRVVLAEASGDFIDVLFSCLTLPLGTIVRLGNVLHQPVEMGSINKLYESVQSLAPDVFWNDICQRMLLSPRNPLEASCQRLKVKVDDTDVTDPTKYFMCHSCSTEKDLLLSTFDGARCYCGKLMRKNMDLLAETAAGSGVFVKGDAKFLIFDDLTVLRSSPVNSVRKFLEHRHKDFEKMPKKSRNVDRKEIFSILKRALISKSPLSDVFLNKEGSKPCCCSRALERLYKNLQISKSPIHWKDCIKIKVMVSKSKNKILFAEADGEFVDFLVSFLTTPLGSILNLTNGKLPLGSIGNLYRSVKVLNPSWFTGSSKESLLNLRVAPHFGCKSSPFQEDDTPNYWYGTVAGKYHNEGRTMISKKKYMLQNPAKQLKLFDPRCSDGAKEPGVGFMKRPCLFVVSDDLKVKQLTTTSSIEYLQKLENVKLGDMEEHLVEIRSHEVMNLLRASLTSNEDTLTRSLCCLLVKWKYCQRFNPFWRALQWMKKRHRKKKEKGEDCNILCCCMRCVK